MNVVIDAGNSLTKVGIFESDSLKRKEVFSSPEKLNNFLSSLSVHHAIVSSVAGNAQTLLAFIQTEGRKLELSPSTPIPIKNAYATPETLGMDRISAACGAWSLYPGENILVADIGTCINFEFISSEGVYHGGSISPGISMRFEAMHAFTRRLPLVKAQKTVPLTGTDTNSCLQSGVMNGMFEELNGIIGRYNSSYPGIRVILTGGDAPFFENLLKPSIFVAPDLVLLGLYRILLHHVPS